eukprot:TRINITY_DN728_c0_g1_i7.p1 TRINITY_DN728_c0_g1~~TRINITY_DN728_c0_g1_i7.p1  ORF type:complete len:223 (+),score=18.25 TRINITY_DN728_c0_g1_i7:269-937(+)
MGQPDWGTVAEYEEMLDSNWSNVLTSCPDPPELVLHENTSFYVPADSGWYADWEARVEQRTEGDSEVTVRIIVAPIMHSNGSCMLDPPVYAACTQSCRKGKKRACAHFGPFGMCGFSRPPAGMWMGSDPFSGTAPSEYQHNSTSDPVFVRWENLQLLRERVDSMYMVNYNRRRGAGIIWAAISGFVWFVCAILHVLYVLDAQSSSIEVGAQHDERPPLVHHM